MGRVIRSEQDGLHIELPDITQRQLEDFLRAERLLRTATVSTDAVVSEVSELIRTHVRNVQKERTDVTTPEYAVAVRELARRVVGLVSQMFAQSEITEVEQSGLYARAAARVGWLGGITEEMVSDWRPGLVSFVVQAIADAIREAREIPPG